MDVKKLLHDKASMYEQGCKVFELVRPRVAPNGPIYGIEPVDAKTIYSTFTGDEYDYVQVVGGKAVVGFSKHDLLIV